MIRRFAIFCWCVASVAVWLVAGWEIANGLLSLTGEMPLWLKGIVRWGCGVVYHDDMPDPEDMQTVAITVFVLLVFAMFAIAVVWLSRLAWKRVSKDMS